MPFEHATLAEAKADALQFALRLPAFEDVYPDGQEQSAHGWDVPFRENDPVGVTGRSVQSK